MPHYNSTQEKGRQLALYEAKVISQEKRIALFFKKYYDRGFTASQIKTTLFGANDITPITSIRRAISDLVGMGILVKTDFKRKGLYDRMEIVFTYNNPS